MKPAATFGGLAGLAGGLAVAAGAFGAHALRASWSAERLEVFETAARYQLVHALALVGVALALRHGYGRALTAAGWLFVSGIVLFSGSLYVLAMTETRAWGLVTPLGGLCFLGGWASLGVGLSR